MTTLFVNFRYLIVPISIIITILGILAGGVLAWTGAAIFASCFIFDTLSANYRIRAEFDESGDSYGIKLFQLLVMYVMLPAFIAIQAALAWRLFQYTDGTAIETLSFYGFAYQSGISGIDLLGAVLSAGLWAGLGIIYGHELSHKKREGFLVSRLIMALSGAAHFCYAHVYQHHLYLGSQDDPATAPRGRNVYHHTWLSHAGQSKFSYDLETKKLSSKGKSFLNWDNRWLLGYAYSLPSVTLFAWAGGPLGIGILAAVWVTSNFLLEALNFMGHYGLIRGEKDVQHRHSWDNDNVFTSWFFIEIGRQADHHVRGETYFWELDDVGGPNYGIGYFTLFALTLVPAIFNRYVQKHLDNWDSKYAIEAEKAIASKFDDNTPSPQLNTSTS